MCSKTGVNPDDPDARAVQLDGDDLFITYAPGDSAESVTGNVVLPASGAKGSQIVWVSGNDTAITIEGIVSRPAAGKGAASVILTATVSKGDNRKAKRFTLVVKDLGYNGNTLSAGTMTDTDGNLYQAVKIGDQVWTAENLRTTRYNDGSEILNKKDSADWVNAPLPGYCYFNNTSNADSIRKYGVLYNWHAVDTKKLAPPGWRVPTDADWKTLESYLIGNGYNWDGTTSGNKIGKSLAAKTDWNRLSDSADGAISNDMSKNNKSGFAALPAGSRVANGSFDFYGSGNWWSSTEYNESGAVARNLFHNSDSLQWNSNYKNTGFSVRLIKD